MTERELFLLKSKYDEFLTWKALDRFVYEAKRNKVWFNMGREWYSPDEFMEIAKSLGPANLKEFTKIQRYGFKLRNPIPIINKMRDHLDQQERKLAEFATRVAISFRGSENET